MVPGDGCDNSKHLSWQLVLITDVQFSSPGNQKTQFPESCVRWCLQSSSSYRLLNNYTLCMLNTMYVECLVGIFTGLHGGNDLIVCPTFVSNNISVATKAVISLMSLRQSVTLAM